MKARSATAVGIVTFLMIIAIGLLLVWKSDFRYRTTGYKVIGHFDNLGGILEGADVRYRGFRVGRVSEVKPSPKQIKVTLWVDGDIEIPKGSQLKIYFDGLVGESYIGVVPNAEETDMIGHNDIIKGDTASNLANFIDIGSQNMMHAEAILDSLRKLITDDSVNGSVTKTLKNFESISFQLNEIIIKLNKSTDAQSISQSLENLERLTSRLDIASERLIDDGDFIGKLNRISNNLALMSENLKSVTDDQSKQDLKSTLDNLNTFSARLAGKDRDSGNIIGAIAAMNVSTETSIRYSPADDLAYYDAGLNFNFGKYFVFTGLGDREEGENQFLHFQHGIQVSDKMTTRLGLYYKKPGFGMDYKVGKKSTVSLDLYDPSNFRVDVLAQYALRYEMNLLFGIRHSATEKKFNNLDLGMRYHF